jgi:hypothetical protein
MENNMQIERPDLGKALGMAGFLISFAFLLTIVLGH